MIALTCLCRCSSHGKLPPRYRFFYFETNKEPKLCILFYFSEEKYGQSSPQAAAAWYEYGNALLLKEEENPANGVLGNVNPDAPVPEDDDVGEENGRDTAAEAAGDEEEGEFDEEDEPEGDLQIAWEALDVSFY